MMAKHHSSAIVVFVCMIGYVIVAVVAALSAPCDRYYDHCRMLVLNSRWQECALGPGHRWVGIWRGSDGRQAKAMLDERYIPIACAEVDRDNDADVDLKDWSLISNWLSDGLWLYEPGLE